MFISKLIILLSLLVILSYVCYLYYKLKKAYDLLVVKYNAVKLYAETKAKESLNSNQK